MRHPLITSYLLLTSFVLLIPPSTQAQISQQCRNAIASGKNRLVGVPSVKLSTGFTKFTDLGDAYPDRPTGRSQRYSFVMKSSFGQKNVMNSPKFMTEISRKIFDNCPSVGIVNFGLESSGHYVAFGLFPNGQIKPFECIVPDGTRRILKWGQTFCV
jgi:hypothetical protein